MAAAGYPTAIFLDLIDRSHNCGLCRQVLRGPVSTKCGHVFCFSCLRNWLARYGLCPLGCNSVELSELRSATEIEEEISRLFVKCTNWKAGCNRIMKLSELNEHQFDCNYSADASSKRVMVGWTGNSELVSRSSSFNLKHSPSIKSLTKSPTRAPNRGLTTTSVTVKIHKTEGESMGFHVVGGEKAADDITISGVLTGYPAHKAGLLDNDKILKVNGVDVATLMHHEVVDLMQNCKANPLPITVERTCHHYEEIETVFPEGNHTLPPVDNRVVRRKSHAREHPKRGSSSPRSLHFQSLSSSTTALSRHSFTSPLLKKDSSSVHTSTSATSVKKESTVTVARTPSLPIKKRIIPTVRNVLGLSNGLKKSLDKEVSGSTSHLRQSSSPANVVVRDTSPVSNGPDSGLSSGDKSPYPENQPTENQPTDTQATDNQALQRNTQYRTSLRTQKEMKQLQQRQRRSSSPAKAKAKNRHRDVKNMGEYELEEITLHKNMSSRLGVTLGYDEKSEDSNIYVVEILPDGIAAQDARLQVGDIITKVNGFEVYDTEEAILYFLEQDPEIVLSVARPIQKKPLQESSSLGGLRRYDSCGSLDSRTVNQAIKVDNKSGSSGYISQECDITQKDEKVTVPDERDSRNFLNHFMNHINELTAESDELVIGDPRIHLHAPRYTSNETQV